MKNITAFQRIIKVIIKGIVLFAFVYNGMVTAQVKELNGGLSDKDTVFAIYSNESALYVGSGWRILGPSPFHTWFDTMVIRKVVEGSWTTYPKLVLTGTYPLDRIYSICEYENKLIVAGAFG